MSLPPRLCLVDTRAQLLGPRVEGRLDLSPARPARLAAVRARARAVAIRPEQLVRRAVVETDLDRSGDDVARARRHPFARDRVEARGLLHAGENDPDGGELVQVNRIVAVQIDDGRADPHHVRTRL